MPYGTIKVDTITFTSGSSDVSVAISGLVQNPTFSGDVTVTGTVSGTIVRGNTVSGATVTGTAGQFGTLTGNTAGFTTVTGTTVTGTTANFVTVSGNTLRTITGIFASGSAASPSITFSGDLDTGLFTGAGNTVGIAANGAAVLTVSGTSIGVGTSSPNTALEIVNGKLQVNTGSSLGSAGSESINTYAATGSRIRFYDNSSSCSIGSVQNGANSELTFNVNGTTERVRIDGSGRVGIGTTSPGSNLDVRFGTNPATDNGGGTNTLRVWTSSALAADAGGAVSFGGVANVSGDPAAWAQIAGRKENATGNAYGGYLQFAVNTGAGTMNERMRLDSSGRLGIGNTSPGGTLDVGAVSGAVTSGDLIVATGSTAASVTVGRLSSTGNDNTTFNVRNRVGTSVFYVETGGGNVGIGTTSPLVPFVVSNAGAAGIELYHGSGFEGIQAYNRSTSAYADLLLGGANLRLANATGEAARIDSSGRLLVGTTSSVNNECIFQTAGGDSIRDWAIKYTGTSGAAETGIRWLDKNNAVNAQLSNNLQNDGVGTAAAHLVFKTSNGGTLSEKMRITNNGYLALGGKITDTSGGDGAFFHGGDGSNYLKADINGDFVLLLRNDTSNPRGIRIQNYGISSGNNANYPIYCDDLGSSRFYFFTNGGLANVQANDINLCDEREKKNIEPLGSTWDCLKSWELKKFHYNEDSDVEDKRYGVIAQQIAAHCPEVINDWVKQVAEDPVLDDEGNVLTPGKEKIVRMGVKEQQMYWMAIKALQEAQVRIEALETEVAALKAQ